VHRNSIREVVSVTTSISGSEFPAVQFPIDHRDPIASC
jgi:hypothetical protein